MKKLLLSWNLWLKFPVQIRHCIQGEIWESGRCLLCTSNLENVDRFRQTYTLEAGSDRCHLCPENAYCLGGARIGSRKGYWRPSVEKAEFIQCPNPEACLGISKSLEQSNFVLLEEKCDIDAGYVGTLCALCAKGYAETFAFTCVKCPGSLLVAARIVISWTVFAIIIIALVRSMLVGIYKPKSLFVTRAKILLDHLQILSISTIRSLNWDIPTLRIFHWEEQAGILSSILFASDCFLDG